MSSPTPAECGSLFGLPPNQTRLYTSTYLFGTNASWLLIGFLITQTYTYYTISKRDSWLLKLLVYGIVLWQCLETATESFVSYSDVTKDWGNPDGPSDSTVVDIFDNLQPLFNSITGFAVQCFFIWRIWSFSVSFNEQRSRTLMRATCVLIFLPSLLALTSGMTFAITGDVATSYPTWFNAVMMAWTVSTFVTDALITTCMLILLRNAKSQSSSGESQDKISVLIRVTLQTNMLTSIVAIIAIPLLVHAAALNGIFGLPWYLIGKFYAISLLGNLNARSHYSQSTRSPSKSPQLTTMGFASGRRGTQDISAFSGVLSDGIINSHHIHPAAQTIQFAEPPKDSDSDSDQPKV